MIENPDDVDSDLSLEEIITGDVYLMSSELDLADDIFFENSGIIIEKYSFYTFQLFYHNALLHINLKTLIALAENDQ